VLVGLGLFFFGAEGSRTPASPTRASTSAAGGQRPDAGDHLVTPRSLVIVPVPVLRAHADRQGAARHRRQPRRRPPHGHLVQRRWPAGLHHALAALIGAVSGLLIGPTTTIFYDSGFLIGLKGFVAAVFAGLASYPLALVGALLVGLLESFASFWASSFKEVIVFSSDPAGAVWRSLRRPARGGRG
jgi:branched-chain amino acid transport system permease protein